MILIAIAVLALICVIAMAAFAVSAARKNRV